MQYTPSLTIESHKIERLLITISLDFLLIQRKLRKIDSPVVTVHLSIPNCKLEKVIDSKGDCLTIGEDYFVINRNTFNQDFSKGKTNFKFDLSVNVVNAPIQKIPLENLIYKISCSNFVSISL